MKRGLNAIHAAIGVFAAVTFAGCATQPAPSAAKPAPAAAVAAGPATGGSMSGKIVWVDLKHSALLVECESNDACKSVQGKKGETYTLTIPDAMKGAAASWKEGGKVQVMFEDRPDGGRFLKSVSGP